MALEILTIPCLSDNYAYLIHDPKTGQTAVVDVPEASPIIQELTRRAWSLTHIFITHHHYDHIDGVPDLLAFSPAQVIGARADAHRLPPLDTAVAGGDQFDFAGEPVRVMDVSGHTVGHIAFYLPQSKAVFTADSLMALGCGRLFEGTATQMWDSLNRLRSLPLDTLVYSGHEYTQSNAAFALSIDPENSMLIARIKEVYALRQKGLPTVPSSIETERATNPFLRVDDPELRTNLNMEMATDTEVFAEIRMRKDRF